MARTLKLVVFLIALTGGAQALAASDEQTQVYRWTDEKGVVHYGDTVPPEYSQNERSVLNRQGVEVGHVAGTKNAADSAEQAREDDLARQRAQHDQFLLSTYASVKDIEQLRDERLEQLDGQVKASASYIDTLDGQMQELTQRAQLFKPYSSSSTARRMPDDLAESLVQSLKDSRTQRNALAAKRQEENDLRAQFDSDISRFRELASHRPQ